MDFENSSEPLIQEKLKFNARARFDYEAKTEEEISFKAGDLIKEITVVEDTNRRWDKWRGTGPDGKIGLFAREYVYALAV